MRELSADEIALLDKYVTHDALASWKRRFDGARTHAMIWRAYQQTRPVETGLYTDRYGYPTNSVRRLHHDTSSYWAKVFLNHLGAVDREITEPEREYVKHRIAQALTGENSLVPFFFEMRMFNAVDRSVARKVSFAEPYGNQHDISVDTGDGSFSIECKSLRSEMQFEGAWFNLAQLNQRMAKNHRQDIETGRAYVGVRITQPSGLKNDEARRSAAKMLADLLHAPTNVQHANVGLISWEGSWNTFEQAADNIWTKFQRLDDLDPSRYFVYVMFQNMRILGLVFSFLWRRNRSV